jgi:polyisoprenoid-binding protein YceI
MDGTSTIHDWYAETQIIKGFMDWDANFPIDPSVKDIPALKIIPKVEVSIPVRSLRSSGKKSMDNVMHDAMKANDFKEIQYVLKEMTLKPGDHNAGDPIPFETKGDITIAGVTKPVSIPVTIEKADGDRLKIVGNVGLKMTTFGITPPAPKIALGLISTGDDVKITFEWLIAKADAKAASADGK